MCAHSLVAVAIVALAVPRLGSAQAIPSPYRFIETRQEVSTFAGWISPGTGRFGYGPGSGALAGVRYGLDFGGPLSLEGSGGALVSTRDVVDPRRAEGNRVIGETDAVLAILDARLKLSLTGGRTRNGFQPFLMVGAGLAWDSSAGSTLEQDLPAADRFDFGTTFVGQLGAGLRWFLTDRVTVRGDGLLYIWSLEAPDGFRDPERGFATVGASEWVDAVSFAFALGYRF